MAPVKLILRESIEHLGDRGEIVSVAPGYARNFLLPKGFALEASAGNLKMLENQRKVWAAKALQEQAAAQAVAEKLSAVQLTVEKKMGEGGTLYGSVTKPEIVELLAAKGFEVDRKQIGPDHPIKVVGKHKITVKVHRKVTATLSLMVTGEGGEMPPEPEKPAKPGKAEAAEAAAEAAPEGEAVAAGEPGEAEATETPDGGTD